MRDKFLHSLLQNALRALLDKHTQPRPPRSPALNQWLLGMGRALAGSIATGSSIFVFAADEITGKTFLNIDPDAFGAGAIVASGTLVSGILIAAAAHLKSNGAIYQEMNKYGIGVSPMPQPLKQGLFTATAATLLAIGCYAATHPIRPAHQNPASVSISKKELSQV